MDQVGSYPLQTLVRNVDAATVVSIDHQFHRVVQVDVPTRRDATVQPVDMHIINPLSAHVDSVRSWTPSHQDLKLKIKWVICAAAGPVRLEVDACEV